MKKWFLTSVALLASLSLWSQNITETFNNAAAAFQSKNFSAAAEGFKQVIAEGENAAEPETVALADMAKKHLVQAYYLQGGSLLRGKNFDAARQSFTLSAEAARQYGDPTGENKANEWIAKIYLMEGGEAFNNKDYASAIEPFAKGYAANPRNTEMAVYLGISYCEVDRYDEGLQILENVASMDHPKYADDAAKAREMIVLYTNNRVAELQTAGDFDGIIALADTQLAAHPENALAQKIRIQAYFSKKDYAKVIELAEEAASVQSDEAERSNIYFILGAAYNAREMKPQAIAALNKVTAGPNVAAARATVAELSK